MQYIRLSSFSLVISGILFVLYPAIRPFSDESSLAGAQAFASVEWMVAHMLAMVAFTLLPLGLLGFYHALQHTAFKSTTYSAVILSILGVGCTLPFYGGETYGLHALGMEAMAQQDERLVGLEAVVRSGPGLMMFLVGMLLLAAAAIIIAIVIWRSGVFSRWSGIPFSLGMALYIPQFFAGQPLRVAHGLLITLSCIWLAVELWRQGTARSVSGKQHIHSGKSMN